MEIAEGPPLPDLPCALVQHPRFARALRACGGRADVLQVRDGGSRVAQVLLVRRGPMVMALRGPVWCGRPGADARVAALRALRRHGLRLIEAETDDPVLRQAGFGRLTTPATLAVLDLRTTPAAQMAAMHGKWRNRLMQARRANVRVKQTVHGGDPAHWLIAAEAAQRRGRYHAMPLRLACAYGAENPGAVQIFTAMQDKAPVAAMLFARHGTRATYHIGWSGAAGRAVSAHHAALMAAAEALAQAGVTEIELGPLDTVNSPGLARFKLGSGARVQRLGGSWIALPGF